jgi:rhamnosyltransferase
MKATVVVLTYNAKPWIEEQLKAVLNQKAPFEFEILIIDSGSTDGTLEVVKRTRGVRLHEIPNSEFGHGKTRNLAAELGRGEIIVYLTHDAVPATKNWLEEMVRPFGLSDKVVCAYGKQIPRGDCCPTVKRDVIGVFAGFGPDHFTPIQQANPHITDQASLDAISFFSDVNSAVRRDLLLGQIPYQDLDYSEDYALGRDVIRAGLMKAYAPLGAVVHSHSYAPMKYFRRMYDEMMGMKKATGQTLDTPVWFHIAWTVKATLKDWRFILRDPSYRARTKLKYLAQAPAYNAFRRVAIRLANRDTVPQWAQAMLALKPQPRKRS